MLCDKCQQNLATFHITSIDVASGTQATQNLCEDCHQEKPLPAKRILSDEEVRQVFQKHVPEIANGEIEIQSIVREPGRMCVVAVRSRSPSISAVSACVGTRGSRVKEISRELGKEKLTVLLWSESIEEFIRAAVGLGRDSLDYKTPAVILDVASHEARVEVDDRTLTNLLADDGITLRLVSRLVGWKLNVFAKSDEDGGNTQ